jgi:predicted O-methyltransferase YrrM
LNLRDRTIEMDDGLENLMAELESFGIAHDAATQEVLGRMLNITRATGEFLDVLVRSAGAHQVLEIGTSNGYSTLWLAGAARQVGGLVTTVEFLEGKVRLASANFARAGLSRFIQLVHDDAGRLLKRSEEGVYDLIFLDSERALYCDWWPELRRVLRPGGLLVVDNATSHAGQMAPFVAQVTSDTGFATCLVPVGKGEFLAVKA